MEMTANLLSVYKQRILNLDDSEDLSTDALLVLLSRDELADRRLTVQEQKQVAQLDDELMKRVDALKVALPNPNFLDDPQRWWWYLHERPQASRKAEKTAG